MYRNIKSPIEALSEKKENPAVGIIITEYSTVDWEGAIDHC
jgi:hypothetical protein